MIKEVIKADGSVEKFDLDKLSKWAKYASKVGGEENKSDSESSGERNRKSPNQS